MLHSYQRLALALSLASILLPTEALATAPPQRAPENLLANPSFETGGASVADWVPIWPRQLATTAPTFETTDLVPKDGERAALIDVPYKGGYSSFTQDVPIPPHARSVHFEGVARVEDHKRAGSASIMVAFSIPGSDRGSVHQSIRVTAGKEWQRVSVDVAIPEGATAMLARCGVFGPCRAAFDDLVLTTGSDEIETGRLSVAIGDYSAVATLDVEEPHVSVSIPFSTGGQTPLGIRVTSEPEGAVVGLATEADRENRPLQVRLRPMARGETIKLRVETWTMLHARQLSDGDGVELPNARRLPSDVKQHLAAAPGVEIEAASIVAAAEEVQGDDLKSAMHSLAELLFQRMNYEGGNNQGAVACLELGKGVCTGYANTAAAVLNARGMPTRILACTFPDTWLQEHYVIETWTKALGWSRMESTSGTFPYDDTRALIVRIVYPDSRRSGGNVPLYVDAAPGVQCRRRGAERGCWQGGYSVDSFVMSQKDFAKFEKSARAAFESLTKTSTEGSTWSAFAAAKKAPRGAKDVAERVLAWLAEPGNITGDR